MDNTKPSGWATMADLGQTEFTPLYGYFINNKTGSEQTLTVNYKQNVSPSDRLFSRNITAGWNVIGVADPADALRQKENNSTDTNNIQSILSSFGNNIDSVLDFTADQTDKSSVKIGDSWAYKTNNNLNDLNDLRETKAYAVYVKTAGVYHGYQNNDEVKIYEPVTFYNLKSGTKVINEKTKDAVLMEFSVYSGYPVNFSLKGVSVELWSYYNMKNSDVGNLRLVCNNEQKIILPSPVIGINSVSASSSLPVGASECKLLVDIGDIVDTNYIQATIRGLDNPDNWKIFGNTIRNISIPSEIRGYWVEVDKNIPVTVALHKTEAAHDKVNKNQNDVELGSIKITPSPNGNIELRALRFSIAFSGATTTLNNIKLIDGSTGNIYDLTYSGVDKKYQNTSLNLAILSNTTKSLVISADIGNTAVDGDTFTLSMADATTDLDIYDTTIDKKVIEITPNALFFNPITIQTPALTFSINPISTALSSVVGTSDIQAINFNMKANQTSDLTVSELD
ncbi:MAG: hypothetical protein PHO56_03450, partial [Patescibacteria group bacterium]|nr:hypothetical protein [Patescibacteria group bacterium]